MDKFTIYNTLGEADVAASANAYARALTIWKAENEIPSGQIEEAVEAVFDTVTGRIPVPALVNFAVNRLSQDPRAFKSLSSRVHAYVTAQKRTESNPSGRLEVVQGKLGGVSRLFLPGQSAVKSA